MLKTLKIPIFLHYFTSLVHPIIHFTMQNNDGKVMKIWWKST